ncbi:outer membrane lipoprotein-sorting protein [Fuchsiella alkaliacetigena]|uniref:outer membrane lipoprotein-sorting protein n=1 Tax=Fuchsiella alkaliacetigena TaxID=957042 RepID=UPI00200A5DCB|nr:outer membrane lipoprotein-sorting protein [Fuchsiella alkaliacetigena]MCK8824146.1 outer membrane lipoprotein-sorting protein [Fuchsiella alkaliacetigena]
MKKVVFTLLILSLFLVSGGYSNCVLAAELTAEEIMERVDENEYLESARMEAKMIIEDRGRETIKEMYSYTKGENSLSEFTNPRDRGTRYLKLGDDLWMYFPAAEDLVSISGHMMREGMMGSDFSYEDIMESQRLTELYNFELQGEEVINGRDTYVVSAVAREDKDASYYQRKIWIDQERFVILKEEYFSTGGRLLKVMEVKEVKEFPGQRWFPVEVVMNNKLKAESKTTLQIKELDFDYDIPESKISLETLE